MPLRAMDFESIEYADFSTRAGGRRVAEVRTREEVALVLELVAMGRNDCEIAREAGIPRSTVRQWRKGQTPDFDRRDTFKGPDGQPRRVACVVCGGDPLTLPQASYTYLLGLYLGDGCLTACPRNVYKLRIACAERYPELIRECGLAMAQVVPNKVGRARKRNERYWGLLLLQALAVPVPPARTWQEARAEDRARALGSRSWSTSTRDPWSVGCSTPTGAGC